MDRRKFLARSGELAGALALAGCGGSGEEAPAAAGVGTEPSAGTTPVPPSTPSSPPSATRPPATTAFAANTGSFVTWDGGSGPTSQLWSHKLYVPWRNRGTGDWLDANQRPQGTTPYATANIAATGPVPFDVTALVRRWVGGASNSGFYLLSRRDWPFVFAGRLSDTAAVRPRLIVVTDKGTFNLPAIANAHWTPTSVSGRDSQKAFQVQKDIWFAVVQFELRGVSGIVRSATLTLTCQSMRSAGAVELYEADPPGFRLGGGGATARQGVAASYPGDRNIATDPRVLFAADFSDIGREKWDSGGANAEEQVFDPNTRSTYLRASIPANGLWGCGYERNVVGGTANGVTDRVVDELYARYYVFLEETWGSKIEINKMPGLDARLGFWSPGSRRWTAVSGNGGERANGKKAWNDSAKRWEYQGCSIRGHGGMKAGDGNPYDDLFWLGSYVYNLDQGNEYGDHVKWNGTAIAKGRWYCIEQQVKMNSIIGPYDSVGNGEAVRDGELRAWVDGVLVYERTNFRWRRHPEMGLQGFWLNWYHGGRQASPTEMHFRMNSVVIAREYIGPRKDG